MTDNYQVKSTSKNSSVVEDRVLSTKAKSRRILRPEIVANPNNPSASVKITILYQKATSASTFEDIQSEPLTTMKAREIGKLILDTEETLQLFSELKNLYTIHEHQGVPLGDKKIAIVPEHDVIITDSKRAIIIKELIDQKHSDEVWQQLVATNPDIATRLSLSRIQENRSKSLEEFQLMLTQETNENTWQKFFEKNTWIFGYGLNYQILKTVSSQPHYGGQTVDGSGESKGDFLKSTQGVNKFTVLVEIKKANTTLLDSKQYRNSVFSPSYELIGGTSQLRVNAKTWVTEGSRTEKNRDQLEGSKTFTVKPKLILVIGNTNELDCREKRDSFELFRHGQNDVEIITFDEIFERAKYIVGNL